MNYFVQASFLVLSLLLPLVQASGASATSRSNTPKLINQDGCVCVLTTPDYVCPREPFTAQVRIYRENGRTNIHEANYPVTTDGIAGATASPTAIPTCPYEGIIDCNAGPAPGGGILTLKVGGCSVDIRVLTTLPGQWTVIRNPTPPNPTGNQVIPYDDLVLDSDDSGIVTQTRRTGSIRTVYFVKQYADFWRPSSDGTEVGGSYSQNVQVSANIGANFTLYGVSLGAGVTASVSVNIQVGPEPGVRFRAYPVVPAFKVIDHRSDWAYRTIHPITGTSEWIPSDMGNQVFEVGDTLINAGRDQHVEAACGPAAP